MTGCLSGPDHREAIWHDIAHFQRLGLDVIRLHVFDRQISDEAGAPARPGGPRT